MADHTDPEVSSVATEVGAPVAMSAPGETLGNTLAKTVGGARVEPGEHVVELFESCSGIRKRMPVTLEPSRDHEMALDFGSGR